MSIMAVRKEELIREYAKAIREGNAAIFGGAGLVLEMPNDKNPIQIPSKGPVKIYAQNCLQAPAE